MFKVAIIDLETGKTDAEFEASAICAGFQIPSEGGARATACVAGPVIDAAYATDAADSARKKFLDNDRVSGAYNLLKLMRNIKDEED